MGEYGRMPETTENNDTEKRRRMDMESLWNNAVAWKVRNSVKNAAVRFFREEDGIGTVEMILILVVWIGLVIIFKSELTKLVNTIFGQITSKSRQIY